MAAIEFGSTPLFNDASLISYYKLENLTDSKGSNTLTNHNGVAFNPAKFNNGADFGTNNTIKYLSAGNLGIDGGAVTIAGWIKRTGNGQRLIAQCNDNSDVEYVIEEDATTIYVRRERINVASDSVSYTVDPSSKFYYVVLTYDTVTLRLYVDGVERGTPVATSGNGTGTNPNAFTLGANINGLNQASGIIDDVIVFSRALTAGEISNLYNGSAAFLSLI